MKALSINNNKKLEVINIPKPLKILDDEVLIEIKYSTFCKDDMRYNDSRDVFSKNSIVGHEASGVILDVGEISKHNGFEVGDEVVVLPIDYCGVCVKCLQQEFIACNEIKLVSGTMSKYVVRKYRSVKKILNELSFKQASLIEPISTVLKTLEKLNTGFDKRVLIIGAGFMSLVFVKLLKMQGVKKIVVIEPLKERRENAIKNGADFAFNPSDNNIDFKLLEATNYYGFDFVIETSSNIDALVKNQRYLARCGTLVIFSHYGPMKKITFSTETMLFSNITVIWSTLFDVSNFTNACYLIKSLDLDKLITYECSIDNSIVGALEYENNIHYKVGINNFD